MDSFGGYFFSMLRISSSRSAYAILRLTRSSIWYGSSKVMPQSRNNRSFVCIGCLPVFMTTKVPFGMAFSSSAVMSGRSIICRLSLGLSLLRLTEPERTVLLPRAFERTSAVCEFGARPPKIVSCTLSTMISAPSLP